MVEPGTLIEFHYPVTTHVRWLGEAPQTIRYVLVKRVRDLVVEPLTLREYLQRPFVIRSRWLITGVDQCCQRYRQFYLGCSPEFSSPSQLRIALYSAESARPQRILHRPFEPTLRDRKELMRLAESLRDNDTQADLQLRIFADDLRLVRSLG